MLSARTLRAMSRELEKIANPVVAKPKPALVGQALVDALVQGAQRLGQKGAANKAIVPLLRFPASSRPPSPPAP